jgi:hypothetical protein
MFAALQIPKAYLGYEGDVGSKSTLAQQDVRFSRTIERIQKIVVSELNKIAIIHLFLLGYRGKDLVDFEIKLTQSSTISEQQKLELWRIRFEIASAATEGVLDRETIYREIFDLSDQDIERVREGKRFDKLEDLTLEAMQAPGQEAAAPAAGEESLPGEEELPKTLGGEAGGEAPPETPPPENAGALSSGPIIAENDEVEEMRNPGSEGNDAFMATDKGKNLFSTGEDQNELVFGTEKQTSSDPYDMRAQRRLVTRPFSEVTDATDNYLKKSIKESEKVDQEIASALKEIKKFRS